MTGSRCARTWIKLRYTLLSLTVTGPVAVGQQPPGARPEKEARPQAEVQAESVIIPVFDFPGGTVRDYVQQLGEQLPGFNFVVSPRVREVTLPPLSLKQVSAQTAIQLLEAVGRTAKAGVTASLIGEENSVWLIDSAEPSGVSSLFGGGQPPPVAFQLAATPAAPNRVQVFSISLLLALEVKPETILTAVETALEMQPDVEGSGGPAIKFHEEAGLLIVRGSGDEIRIVEEVITSIEKGKSGQRHTQGQAAANPSSSVVEALQAENQKLRMEIELLRKKLETLLPVEKPSAPRDEKQAR